MSSLTKTVVCENLAKTRQVVRITGPNAPARYKIKQGKLYIGKITDGGYRTLKGAVERMGL